MLQVYFIYSGTYTDTAIITRANVRVYGQTNSPSSYTGNSAYFMFSDEPVGWLIPGCRKLSLSQTTYRLPRLAPTTQAELYKYMPRTCHSIT